MLVPQHLFAEQIKRNGRVNWNLVGPLFFAPLLPLTRIAISNVPGNHRIKIYLSVAGAGGVWTAKSSFFRVLVLTGSFRSWRPWYVDELEAGTAV